MTRRSTEVPFRLLLSFAHPDDESFGMGAAIAKYAREGVQIALICSTNGDVGSVAPEFLDRYGSVAAVRLAALRCAAEPLGISEVVTYGYRDSGMMGTPDNQHPDCLWQADESVVVGRLVSDIRRLRPHVVVTVAEFGGYGHPEHIFMHRATVKAFHLAGDPGAYPEQIAAGLAPWQPDKLYYNGFPKTVLRIRLWLARLRGEDPRHMGKNRDLDLQEALDRAPRDDVRVNVGAYQDALEAAAACHASQLNPRKTNPVMDMLQRVLVRHQSFARAYPEHNGSRRLERDLFEGITPRP